MNRLLKLLTKNIVCMVGGLLVLIGAALTLCSAAAFLQSGLPLLSLLLPCLVWAAGLGLLLREHQKEKREKRLLDRGYTVQGTVRAVTLSKYTKWHTSVSHVGDGDAIRPYTVKVAYTVDGKPYQATSNWYWSKPGCRQGESVPVCVDERDPRKYALPTLL